MSLTYKLASLLGTLAILVGLVFYGNSKLDEIVNLKHQLQVANMRNQACEANRQMEVRTLTKQIDLVKQQNSIPDEVREEFNTDDTNFTILASGGIVGNIKEKLCKYCVEYKEVHADEDDKHRCYWDGNGYVFGVLAEKHSK